MSDLSKFELKAEELKKVSGGNQTENPANANMDRDFPGVYTGSRSTNNVAQQVARAASEWQ